jgi:hypothetical protein
MTQTLRVPKKVQDELMRAYRWVDPYKASVGVNLESVQRNWTSSTWVEACVLPWNRPQRRLPRS